MSEVDIAGLLEGALAARAALFDQRHESAFRLFNGFQEGCPTLVADLYARTLLLHNYADPPQAGEQVVQAARAYLHERLPWLQAIVLKTRSAQERSPRWGELLYGERPDTRIRENGVWYALDLLLNRDASFYLDTRNLRAWAKASLAGKTVLNTFAYTGSLGVAAQAGGAARVLHIDLNRRFLNVAKTSYTLNGFPISKENFQAGDFWTQVSGLKRSGARFGCVLLDPPFFATTSTGQIELVQHSTRLINKLRPLIVDGGYLVAVNNALYLEGARYLSQLESLCQDGYVEIRELIPVPEDCVGYPETRVAAPLVDPAPFNSPTKIALLQVRRKAGS